MATPKAARLGRRAKRSTNRHSGELCPVTLFMMPFGLPLLLAMRFRKWLRLRAGRKVGNVLGKVAITLFGRPPLLLACFFIRLMLLVPKALNKVEELTRKRRAA